MHKAREELMRTKLDLGFLSVDACVLLARYQHQQQVMCQFVLGVHAEGRLGNGLAYLVSVNLQESMAMLHGAHELFCRRNMLPQWLVLVKVCI